MNPFLFLESRNLFCNPPVDFEDFDTAHDYDTLFGAEKYAYNAYRHYLLPYLDDTQDKIVFDVNCGKGYALATLKAHYGFKKAIGYQSDPKLAIACKDRHSNIQIYKDFIMSKQKNADYIFAYETFQNYDNKSALLLRLRQALAPNGHLFIIQSTSNLNELENHFSILERTHGLTTLYAGDISPHVFNAVNRMSEQNVWKSADYAGYQTKYNYDKNYSILVRVLKNV